MHMPDLFLERAAQCEAMAKIASEPDSKKVWARMAERWHRCAEVEKRERLLAVKPAPMQHRH